MQPSEETHQSSDPTRIHLNESWEINHWCEEFNLRAEELREIIKKVGPEVQAVREHLTKRQMTHEKPF